MGNEKKFYDRRKHQRYKIAEGTFAAFRNSQKRGLIMDISKGGLAFTYHAFNRTYEKSSELDIYLPGFKIFMTEIKVTIISEMTVPSRNPYSTIPIKKCGVEFNQLNPEQILQLEFLLQTHALGPVVDYRTYDNVIYPDFTSSFKKQMSL